MLKIENTEVYGWQAAIRGLRNPLNSWAKSDSYICNDNTDGRLCNTCPFSHIHNGDNDDMDCDRPECGYIVGKADFDLMCRMNASTEQSKYRRMITVTFDVVAPLYWFKEADTYKVGTVCNSCSTMHTIHKKPFELDDFSHEHLFDEQSGWIEDVNKHKWCSSLTLFETIINTLNAYRFQYIETKNKSYWWQMIQLLPSSYNQRRTYQMNYEVLAQIYRQRKNHKLDEWRQFCDWIKSLPYSELITGEVQK